MLQCCSTWRAFKLKSSRMGYILFVCVCISVCRGKEQLAGGHWSNYWGWISLIKTPIAMCVDLASLTFTAANPLLGSAAVLLGIGPMGCWEDVCRWKGWRGEVCACEQDSRGVMEMDSSVMNEWMNLFRTLKKIKCKNMLERSHLQLGSTAKSKDSRCVKDEVFCSFILANSKKSTTWQHPGCYNGAYIYRV